MFFFGGGGEGSNVVSGAVTNVLGLCICSHRCAPKSSFGLWFLED